MALKIIPEVTAPGELKKEGCLNFAANTAAGAQFNLAVSAVPTSPVDGDVWREDNTNTGLKIRVNGVTKTITLS